MATETNHLELARALAERAKEASRPLSRATTEHKNRVLARLASLLEERRGALAAANQLDVEAARTAGLAAPLVDRLLLDDHRLDALVRSVREVAALPDPVGETTEQWTRPNGIHVSRVRIPLGVIMIIYEARPNVTIEAAALCIKSGNAVILRGGKEAMRTNVALGAVLAEALAAEGLPSAAAQLVDDPDRDLMLALLQQDALIDLAIPRGGEGLIRFVAEHARVPVIKHYKGVCHLYVDRAADLAMAARIAFDGKVSRPGVCNSLEGLVVDHEIAARALPVIAEKLVSAGVELRCDPEALAILGGPSDRICAASPDDYGREFLALVIAVKVVSGYEEALDHLAKYGSLHTEIIVTDDEAKARRFTRDVEASMVGWNVSSRFNDGGELGLGAEMGISTTKLHAFGPMGLRELTAQKFVVQGNGQVRS